MSKSTITLGAPCTDSVSGFTGIAVVIAHMHGSNPRVFLQPAGVDSATGDMKKGYYFEWGRLTDAPVPSQHPHIGKKVKDDVTGLDGTVIVVQEHLKGCILYEVQPEGLQADGKMKEASVVDEARLFPKSQSPGAVKQAGKASAR